MWSCVEKWSCIFLFFWRVFLESGSCAGQLPVVLQLSSALQEESHQERNTAGQGETGRGGITETKEKKTQEGGEKESMLLSNIEHNLHNGNDFVPQPSPQGQVFLWSAQQRNNKIKFKSSYNSSVLYRAHFLPQHVGSFCNKTPTQQFLRLIAGRDTETEAGVYLRAAVERLSETAMHACRPVHACLCACAVRGGRTGPETTTIHPHPTWTVTSARRRPNAHTP